MNQTSIFDFMYPKYKITKPIRLIEFFAGYGSQALALKYLGIEFEHWKICEWAIKSIQAYKDIHFSDDKNDYSKNLTINQINEQLYRYGISRNYNEPMTWEEIKKNSKKNRQIYNNMIATHNLVNIQQVHANNLEIVDTDKYTYLLTYSFPCQDLSLAGKGKGMSDTSTRSGMLWEVERILCECKELGTMPEVLLMENVPQVHGTKNVDDFNRWQLKLEELGYKNYFQDLIATDYGIPQTRNRCFMVSILGDYSYTFPKPIPLKLKLKDLLEDEVDEKYYLSDRTIEQITNWKSYENPLDKVLGKNSISPTITTRIAESQDGGINASMKVYSSELDNTTNIRVKKIGNVNPSGNGMNGEVIDSDGVSSTLTTNKGEGIKVLIKNATKKGYLEASIGDGIDISSRMEHHRGTVQKEKSQTLTTSCEVGTINGDLKIRKLTPKECFRLMGVKDEDFEKVAKKQNDSSLYHLVGDSIVVNVLMAIFKEMI